MSLLTKPVSLGHINGAPAISSSPKKGDQAGGVTKLVLDRLTQQAVRTLSLDATLESVPAKKREAVDNIMHLKRIQFQRGKFQVPPLDLQLSRQETHLLDTIFESWSLNQQISLLDLWGIDLFVFLEKFLQFFPKNERETLLAEFCTNFILGSVSMMMEESEKPDTFAHQLDFYERGKSPQTQYLVMTRKEWAFCLEDIKSSLNAAMSTPKGRIKQIQSLFKEVQNRLNLGCKLLRHQQALCFLRDFNLLTLEPYFPKAQALIQGGIEKSLSDLTTYVRFLEKGFSSGCSLGKLSVGVPFFEKFHGLLTTLQGSKDLARDAQNVKTHLAEVFSTVANLHTELAGNYFLAQQGKLSHESFCRANGIQVKVKKSPKEFADSLYFKFGQVDLFNAFTHDCLDIFDQRIMESLFPDTFVASSVAFNRLAANLSYFLLESSGLMPSPVDLASPPAPLPQAAALKALVGKIHENLSAWTKAVDPDALLDATLEWRKMNEGARIFYNQWIPYIARYQPAVNATCSLILSLDSIRQKTLEGIGEFLRSCDLQEVRQNRAGWIDYFREVCFQEGLGLCRITMLANDMRAVLAFKTDLSAMNSEEHLLPSPLVDFLDLEGIEEVLNRFLPPQQPMGEDLEDKPIRARVQVVALAKLEKPEGKKQPSPRQAAPQPAPQVRQEPEIFKIRRGEKTRKILARLHEMGFLPTKARRGGTSHLKLESKEGKKTIVPMHRDQKPGTARSIEKQTGKRSN